MRSKKTFTFISLHSSPAQSLYWIFVKDMRYLILVDFNTSVPRFLFCYNPNQLFLSGSGYVQMKVIWVDPDHPNWDNSRGRSISLKLNNKFNLYTIYKELGKLKLNCKNWDYMNISFLHYSLFMIWSQNPENVHKVWQQLIYFRDTIDPTVVTP